MRGVVVDALVAGGVGILLLCSLGLLAMRNAYDRLHYASAAAWGVLLLSAAIVVRESLSLIGDKALAIALILLVCGPALVHATARAGRIRERGSWRQPRTGGRR